MEQEEKLSLDFGNGEIYEVWLEVATYPADKNIKVCVFTEKEEEIWKLFELTTDMGIPLEKNQTFLLPGYDLEQIVEFIKKNGLGQLKEEICCSGCMEYPLFEFQEETLKKLDPEGYAAYEQAYQERGEVKNPEFQKGVPQSVPPLQPEYPDLIQTTAKTPGFPADQSSEVPVYYGFYRELLWHLPFPCTKALSPALCTTSEMAGRLRLP